MSHSVISGQKRRHHSNHLNYLNDADFGIEHPVDFGHNVHFDQPDKQHNQQFSRYGYDVLWEEAVEDEAVEENEGRIETAYDSSYTDFSGVVNSLNCGSDNLLVTFDYGYSDSIDEALQIESNIDGYIDSGNAIDVSCDSIEVMYKLSDMMREMAEEDDYDSSRAVWISNRQSDSAQGSVTTEKQTSAAYENPFPVHRMQHDKKWLENSLLSIVSSLVEYAVDEGDTENEDKNVAAKRDGVDDNDEEQFYDSIECA